MLTEKKEQTAAVIAEGDRLSGEYETARRRLDKARPEGERLQDACELAAMRVEAYDRTGSHDFPDLMFRARGEELDRQLEEAKARRDGLVVPLAREVERSKQALFAFNSRIGGSFTSWAARVASGLGSDHVLAIELQRARREIEDLYLGPTSKIIAVIRRCVEKVEGSPSIDAPIFRLPGVPAAA